MPSQRLVALRSDLSNDVHRSIGSFNSTQTLHAFFGVEPRQITAILTEGVREIAGRRADKHHGQASQCLCDEHQARCKPDRIQYCVSPNTCRAKEPVFLLNRKVCRSSVKGTKLAHAESKVGGPLCTNRFRVRIPAINMS